MDLREPCRVLEAGPVGRYWGVLGVFWLQLVNRGWRGDILPIRVSICWTILMFGCQTLDGSQYLGHKGSRRVGTPTRHVTRDSTAARLGEPAACRLMRSWGADSGGSWDIHVLGQRWGVCRR